MDFTRCSRHLTRNNRPNEILHLILNRHGDRYLSRKKGEKYDETETDRHFERERKLMSFVCACPCVCVCVRARVSTHVIDLIFYAYRLRYVKRFSRVPRIGMIKRTGSRAVGEDGERNDGRRRTKISRLQSFPMKEQGEDRMHALIAFSLRAASI